MTTLTSHEIDVLKMLAGEREPEWGARVTACLEYLAGAGHCTKGPSYQITVEGRAELERAKRTQVEAEVIGR